MQHNSMPPPGSQPGSLSSGGSGASTRELYGQRDNNWQQTYDADQRMTKMQEDHLANLARMQSDRTRSEAALNQRINDLENENRGLKDSYSSQENQIKQLLAEVAALKARQQGTVAA